MVLLALIAAGFGAALIVADGLTDERQAADVAIVLGNTVDPNGRPSARLQARLDKAIELYQDGLFTQVIVSGGVGAERFDEAAVMRRYLIEHGLPQSQVWADSAGDNTEKTARNAAHLMRAHGWRSALVISQYFHIARCKLALRRHGIAPVFSAHADFFEPRDIYSTMREVLGYMAYAIQPIER